LRFDFAGTLGPEHGMTQNMRGMTRNDVSDEANTNELAPIALSRRELIGKTGVTVLGVAVGAAAVNRLVAAYLARSNLAYEGLPTPDSVRSAITPTEDFYIVSKNLIDPNVIGSHWQLELRGLVGKEQTWNYEQLL